MKFTKICFKSFSKTIIGLLVIALIGVLIVIFIKNSLPMNSSNAYDSLQRDRKQLQTVADYLLSCEHDFIKIDSTDGKMYVDYITRIDDEKVKEAVNDLLSNGYDYIQKTNSLILFVTCTWLSDFENGLLYSLKKEEDINFMHLSQLNSLSFENWYYFETEY